jgi:glycosyltransferase involved in cell wall biosynthesis
MRGGLGAYLELLSAHPPDGVAYSTVGGYHTGAEGAACNVALEIALNRLVRPRTIPDSSFRALSLKGSFDLVHVHAQPARLSRLRDTPLVMGEGSNVAVYLLHYLGWEPDRLARAFSRTRGIYRALGIRDRLLATERAAAVYVFSEWAKELSVQYGVDPEKIEVVLPGFPDPSTAPRVEPRDTFTYLLVGTEFERKGGFEVVEAFARVSGRHPEARLVVAGSDPWERNPDRVVHGWVDASRRTAVLAKLEHLEGRGVAKRYGLIPSSRVRDELYPEADAFVMPTRAEGFGLTNVEAMSYGLPVVSTRVGPIPEVIDHERTGLLIEPGDVDALEASMEMLIADRDWARRMGDSARQAFIDRYTLDQLHRRIQALYRRALDA